ncbi:unnamed protein product [Caenorhabditis auriculariae]|uniref:UPAR/Ly6 domain-containing protein n=1 Tax=Caenorhabditis auriculariae TaxID=2777116 RepID=A0A8S1GV70_9PELO|nr:unnamed protein product [Caenorhabditis auriculariae]
MLKVLIFAFLASKFSLAFECFTCNTNDRNQGPCIDRKTVCRNSSSCSMAVMFRDGKSVVRKFCTPPSTPIYQYLMMLSGASMCQNVDPKEVQFSRTKRQQDPAPPATPGEQASLLCVCTTPLCNRGSYIKVVENTMLNNLPQRLLAPPTDDFKGKGRPLEVLDESLAQQMADAGF